MLRRLKNSRGMTLVEIIIALAFIGIIMVSLLSMFSLAFSNLTSMGERSRTNVEAQKIMDRIYEEARFTNVAGLEADVDTVLTNIVGTGNFQKCTSLADFDSAYNNKRARYIILDETGMFVDTSTPSVTLKLFYQNGRHFVTLTSPVVNGSQ